MASPSPPAATSWSRRIQADANKRTAILDAACTLFARTGFDGTSMDAVARLAGVTKATLYAKFGNKARLFDAALERLGQRMPTPGELARGGDTDIRQQLQHIAVELLAFATSQEALGICRMLALPSASAMDAGKRLWEARVVPHRITVAALLRDACLHRELHIQDPDQATVHFFSLALGDPVVQMLMTAQAPLSADERVAHVETALALFIDAYRQKPLT